MKQINMIFTYQIKIAKIMYKKHFYIKDELLDILELHLMLFLTTVALL